VSDQDIWEAMLMDFPDKFIILAVSHSEIMLQLCGSVLVCDRNLKAVFFHSSSSGGIN
jgi:hypothetical protein